MKSSKLFLITVIMLHFISSAKSQWIPCQGIEGGNVSSITYQDSALFVVGFGGVFKKQIDAESWDSACLVYNVSKVRSTGTALFTFGGNIMSDLFRSLDNGISWEELEHDEYFDIESFDNVIFIGTYGSLKCSSDNGETWTDNYPASVPEGINALYSQPGMLFCQIYNVDTLFLSDNYGNSWIKFPLNGLTGKVCPYLFNGTLWLAQGNNFFIFNNPEQEWIMQNDSLPPGTFVSNFIEDEGLLGCYTNNGYFLLDELNSTWQDQSQGLENRHIWDACKVDSTIYIATESGPFSKSGSENWAPQYDDLFGIAVSHVFVFGARTYALTNGKIYRSNVIENGFELIESQGYCPANDLVVTEDGWYEGSACGFSISLDSGQTWTDFSAGLENLIVERIVKTNVYFYAATHWDQGLYRSLTYHNAWERVPNELGTMAISDLETLENKIFALTSNGLYRSVDFGTSFSLLTDAGNGSLLLAKNNVIFLMRDEDIVYSMDAGNSWQKWIDDIITAYPMCMDVANSLSATVVGGFVGPWNPLNFLELFDNESPHGVNIIDDLPPFLWSSIHDVMIDNEKIFACPSSGGLWYRDDLSVGQDDFNPGNLKSSGLSLCPNPVNDILTVQLNDNMIVNDYRVYDYSGKMIMMGKMNSASDDFPVDVSDLANGIYLIVIQNDNNVLYGKFIKTE